MAHKLVIVESPTKARTIKDYLPKGYKVEASMGSVRDLPAKAADIPAAYKKEKWSRLGVNVEEGFRPLYIVSPQKKKVIKQLKEALKGADELIIATDEDREGESIGWHLLEVLKPTVPVKRMVFHEITKPAIEKALEETRDVDTRLVRAQETRRILDRLVGYTISPLLWKKIARGLSAGRVQSVAVRLLVMRERERRAFRSGSYWDLVALLGADTPPQFSATMISLDGRRLATGKDFDPDSGKIIEGKDVLQLSESEARMLHERLANVDWVVENLTQKEETRNPAPPFITSTLQQEANRKLGMSARRTMQVAQRLYERGLITYMRTDSVNLSEQAIVGLRAAIEQKYGAEYLSPEPRRFRGKSKGAQEAHEAIRPAGTSMPTAEKLALGGEEAALYELIWKRSMACQMANARLRFTSVTVAADDARFRASGKEVQFPGFFRAYVEGSDDPEASLEDQESPLPPMNVGDRLKLEDLTPQGHDTKPPVRFTEASLVQALEKEGIGRPSTYATIISTIQDRGYVKKQGSRLIPTFTAMAVVALLEEHFPDLVDLGFTAHMEDVLDEIASGQAEWEPYLRSFYAGDDGLSEQVKEREEAIDPREACTLDFDDLEGLDVRVGRYGAYLEKMENGEPLRASLPEDLGPADLTPDEAEKILEQKLSGDEALGQHPETQEPIYVKVGPYGPYVQLGDPVEGEKVKRTAIPKGTEPGNLTLDQAIKLLDLPRTLGDHPETGKPVKAGIGRFGPFVVHDGVFASLKKGDDVLDVELPRALELFELKKTGKRGLVKVIGEHPGDREPIELYDGRYGPYIKHGGLNAPIPRDTDPEELDVDTAAQLLKEKGKAPGKGRRKAAKKSSGKKKAKKTTAKKKGTAKKSTGK